jgi:predicted Zn-dependent protease
MSGTSRTIIGFLICGCVLSLAWAGYVFYQNERHQMYLRNGRQALERSDARGALICTQQAVRDRPNDAKACRLMADVQDALDFPTALTWRMRLVELEPVNVRNYVSWAETALKLANPGLALKALNSAPKERVSSGAWQNLMGQTEAALGQTREADAAFNEAVRLEPANRLYAINLSSLRLGAVDASIAAEARRRLEELARSGPDGITALRALLRDALNHNELERAQTLATEVEKRSDADFDDDLLVLEVRSRMGTLNQILDRIKQRAAEKPRDTVSLAYWLMGHRLAGDADKWLEKSYQLSSAPVSVQMAYADVLIAQGKWAELESDLSHQKWSENEFLRLASIARSLREQQAGGFSEAWRQATESAREDPSSRFQLGVLVLSWGWKVEASELLWRVAETAPQWRSQALWILWQMSRADHNAAGLLRVASNQHEDEPDDIRYKNNYAFYLLLLNLEIERAGQLAEECWRQEPLQPNVASTYAFALYRANRSQEGVQVLEKLSDKDLHQPNTALYYALLLSATGQNEKASQYLALLQKTDQLLPQELELAERLSANLTNKK